MLRVYRGAAAALGAFAPVWLASRARAGKEDPARLSERYGRSDAQRPVGALIWLHAASVGESGVALQLADALAQARPGLSFLISSGTRTSADLIARRRNARTRHVYAPLDRADAVAHFLTHWKPDLGVFVESELWPNLIMAAQNAGLPLALVNARMSPSSLRRLDAWRASSRELLGAFAHISAADQRTGDALSRILQRRIATPGNLKLAAPAPAVDAGARAALLAQIGARRVWLAASTHAGEDEIVLAAHDLIRRQFAESLLILAPRHPERGGAVAALAGGAPRRSQAEPIADAPVYVADTLGELGLFYSIAPASLVAGSLLAHLKGHNPIEPAKLDSAVLTGPHVESFSDIFAALLAAGGARTVLDAPSLAEAICSCWRNAQALGAQRAAAREVVDRGADALTQTVEALLSLAPAGAHHASA